MLMPNAKTIKIKEQIQAGLRQDNRLCAGTFFTIGLRLAQHVTPLTSAITAMGRVCVQHLIFQLWGEFTIWCKSSGHRNINYRDRDGFSQSVLKGSTKCSLISDSASIPLTRFLKAVTKRLVGLCLPPLSKHSESANSIVPPSTSANCASDISSGIFHGGRCKVFLIYSYASILFAINSLVSAITSPLLFRLLVKPKEKTAPSYYQYDDKPMHPLCAGYINQESERKTTKNPSDYKPISFHIITPYLKSFVCFYELYHRQEVNYA